MIVLDASAVVELLLNTAAGQRVAARISDPHESLHAPHLLDVEVIQVLRHYTQSGQVPVEAGDAAAEDLRALDVARYAHEPLLGRVWTLRDDLTAYDGVYVALAEVLDAPLLTLDRRLAGSTGHAAAMELAG
jgi:predicted nucleic acid-binding protein